MNRPISIYPDHSNLPDPLDDLIADPAPIIMYGSYINHLDISKYKYTNKIQKHQPNHHLLPQGRISLQRTHNGNSNTIVRNPTLKIPPRARPHHSNHKHRNGLIDRVAQLLG